MSQVAIVGAGPAAFYTAEALKRADPAFGVDLFDRLPMPFGLARFGIAPDHPRLKAPIAIFERIAAMPGVRFFGGITIGRDVALDALRAAYDAVVLAHGAQGDEALVLPGAEPGQVRTAREIVSWYNGMLDVPPDAIDLHRRHVVVVGNGNVAIDIARLLTRPVEDLAVTDISDRALAALRSSAVQELHLVGRRGPVQARFTTKELRELGELRGVGLQVESDELALPQACLAELEAPTADVVRRNLDLLRGWAARAGDPAVKRRLHLRFRLMPERMEQDADGASWLVLRRVRLEGPPFAQRAVATEARVRIRCDLVIASIGFRVQAIEGMDQDRERGRCEGSDPATKAGGLQQSGGLRQAGGRLLGIDDLPLAGLYAVGWAKRGPSGVVGSNRACAEETVKAMLADRQLWPSRGAEGVARLLAGLAAQGLAPVEWTDWQRLDAIERERGAMQGRPRVKLDDSAAVLAVLGRGCGPST